jgi:predicted O-methyltransferase YrrM
MRLPQARFLRELVRREKISSILELGFFQGKSTAFLAAILEEMGSGRIVTMDKVGARHHTPSIEQTLASLGLQHRATPIYCHRSFTWELSKLLQQNPSPRFDLCYLDGAHTWDGTGFSFFLVDLLLKPGGWIVFADLDWSIAASPWAKNNPDVFKEYSAEEKTAKQVRMVWEILVPARGYENCTEEKQLGWGIGQKPAAARCSSVR